jgi:DNA-binding Lrp family transcriptional regulator
LAALSDLEVRALMELQYNFAFWLPDPYAEASARLGVGEDELLKALSGLRERGVLKRVGFYVNYRSQGAEAALVALSVDDPGPVAEAVANDDLVTHAYVRDDPDYSVWLVVKRGSMDEIKRFAEEISRRVGARDYMVLSSIRTYKLSVKFDLERGISRSGPYAAIRPDPPRPESLGVTAGLLRSLSRLPLSPMPYREVAAKHGLPEDALVSLVPRLVEAGVLADPGAAIDGESAGFRFNGMVVMEPSGSPEELCRAAAGFPYSTHVVLRGSSRPSWRYPCYAMIHAVRRETVEEAAEELSRLAGARSYRVIFSLGNLKPGVTR